MKRLTEKQRQDLEFAGPSPGEVYTDDQCQCCGELLEGLGKVQERTDEFFEIQLENLCYELLVENGLCGRCADSLRREEETCECERERWELEYAHDVSYTNYLRRKQALGKKFTLEELEK